MDVSFLDFLRSGEKDIHAFAPAKAQETVTDQRHASSILSLRPSARATCSRSWSVTEDWSGANNRSSVAGLVFMRLASFAREMRRRFISALNLPRDDALERAGFALRQQAVLLEEVVEVRPDVLLFHGPRVADAAAFSPVPNLPAESSAIS